MTMASQQAIKARRHHPIGSNMELHLKWRREFRKNVQKVCLHSKYGQLPPEAVAVKRGHSSQAIS